MTPIYQTVHGLNGNCFAACLASVLGLTLDQVPAFYGRGWVTKCTYWAASRGYTMSMRRRAPSGYSICHRRVLTGGVHCVVCLGGAIIHDPSPRPLSRPSDMVLVYTLLRKS